MSTLKTRLSPNHIKLCSALQKNSFELIVGGLCLIVGIGSIDYGNSQVVASIGLNLDVVDRAVLDTWFFFAKVLVLGGIGLLVSHMILAVVQYRNS